MKKIISIITLICVTLCLSACGGGTAGTTEKPQVYTSFYAMYDFAR